MQSPSKILNNETPNPERRIGAAMVMDFCGGASDSSLWRWLNAKISSLVEHSKENDSDFEVVDPLDTQLLKPVYQVFFRTPKNTPTVATEPAANQ